MSEEANKALQEEPVDHEVDEGSYYGGSGKRPNRHS